MITKERRASRDVRHRRLRRYVRGSEARPRLAVFRSLNHIYAQLVDDDAGKTLLAVDSRSKEFRARQPQGGTHAGWEYADPAAIMAEVAALTPSYAGVSHERLEKGERLQWPVRDAQHGGTPILHTAQFARGRGKFAPIEHIPPAELISAEHGKVASDAAGEVARGLEVVEFACGIPQLLKGEFTDNVARNVDSWAIRQPVGVCAGITPFNFPIMVPLWMAPIAIACGNTFILKPSERDPTMSLRMAELLAEAGLPDGVFNVVHGDKEAVDALLKHPTVKAISFVGSSDVAQYVYGLRTPVAVGGA